MGKKDTGAGWVTLPISLIDTAEWNYRVSDEGVQRKVDNSVKEFSQIQNIVVRPKGDGRYECIDGNHRLESFRGISPDYEARCFDVGPISDSRAKLISVSLNKLEFADDQERLNALLSSLFSDMEVDFISSVTPFSEDELFSRREVLDFNWDDLVKEDRKKREKKDEFDVSVSFDGFLRRLGTVLSLATVEDVKAHISDWGQEKSDDELREVFNG